jgi:PAS domain S-box-containing protein
MDEKLTYEELLKRYSDQKARINDLQRKKDALEAAKDLKSRVVEVFRSIPRMMAISDMATGRYIDANDTFLTVLGYKREELIDKTSEDLNLFAEVVQSDKFLKKLARLKKVQNFPVKLKSKTGEENSFLFSADTIFFGDDKYLLTTFTGLSAKDTDSASETFKPYNIRTLTEYLNNFIAAVSVEESGDIILRSVNNDADIFINYDLSTAIGRELNKAKIPFQDTISELVSTVILTEQPSRVALSRNDENIEGYLIGIKISSGDIIILREPDKTQRIKERELIIQAGLFRNFADIIPEIVFEFNPLGRLTYASPNGLRRMGYTEDDLKRGISILQLLKPGKAGYVIKNLKRVSPQNSSSQNEYEVITKDGTQISVLVQISARFDKNNKITGFWGVATDLTDRKLIENEINRERNQLDTLIESAPESIVHTSLDGTIHRINTEFTRTFGYTAGEAAGKNINDLIVPPELEDEADLFTSKAAANETISAETTRRTKSGEDIFVNLLIKPVHFRDSTTSLFSIYRNISDKRKDSVIRNVLLNISNAALAQTEFSDLFTLIKNELGTVWDTKNFYIVLYKRETHTLTLPFYADEKDHFTDIPAKGTLTGWLLQKREPVLLKVSDIDILEREGDIGLVGTPCQVWLGVPLIVENDIIGAMVLQDYEDQDAFSQDDLRLLSLIGNQVALAIHRKNMMNNLIAERSRAEEAALLKQQFTSTMSHEIRTPLNEVIGITNLLLQGQPRDDQMEFLKTLQFSANHLLTLVNDVLDYNKIESGMIKFEKTRFNLHTLLGELKRTYSFRTDQKGLEFILNIGDDVPKEIIGDQLRLNQALTNLLSNAVKFTSDGFVELSVRKVSGNPRQANLEFAIRDTGIGIAPDRQEMIFESYTQATDDTTRKYGGTGLGLSIVRKLVELMGDRVWVESEPGEGSTFYLELAFQLPDKQEETESTESGDPEGNLTYDKLAGKRVLIAEDNKINFFVANKFLVKWGVIVTHAENGKEALSMIEKNSYDLVLMDLHMPEMDGIEATGIIRKSEREEIRTLPVVALTAAIMSEHQDKIEGLSINDYILKPFKPQELYIKILKHIR